MTMAFSKEMLEYLHDSGQMPDWIYYQQNGKSSYENYRNILIDNQQKRAKIMQLDYKLAEYKKMREQEIDYELEKHLEKQLEMTIDNILDNILKDFNKYLS